MEKRCTKCGKTKPLKQFGLNRATKNGRHSWCCECNTAYLRAWRERRKDNPSPSETPEAIAERNARWRAKHKLEKRAQKQVELAVAAGRLVPQACDECGAVKTEAHHKDYRHPLVVTWLCRSCHRRAHGRWKRYRAPVRMEARL